MKFTLSVSKKTQAPRQYESFDIFLAIECDTATESIHTAAARAHFELDQLIKERYQELTKQYHEELNDSSRGPQS